MKKNILTNFYVLFLIDKYYLMQIKLTLCSSQNVSYKFTV